MSGLRPPARDAEPPVVTSPNALGLPLLDRGEGSSATTDLVAQRWPEIERLIADRRFATALDRLVELARDMRESTAGDDEAWRPTLVDARGLAYDAIVEVALAADDAARGIAALDEARTWDLEHRSDLDARRSRLEAMRP